MDNDEEWKAVEGFEGRLEVSNLGRVRSLGASYVVRRGTQEFLQTKPPKIFSPYTGNHGYPTVAVKVRNGSKSERKRFLVHRLVARAFVEGYQPGLIVNHIDGDRANPAAGNLEWVSLSENTKHQWATGLVDLSGDNHPSRKLSSKQVYYIRKLLRQGVPANCLATIAGVSASLITLIRDGKRWGRVLPHPQ